MNKQDKEKIASLYASNLFGALKHLVEHEIQLNNSEKKTLDSFEKTALNLAKIEGGEEFGRNLLRAIERCYKNKKK